MSSSASSPTVRKPAAKPSILSRLSSASPTAIKPKTTTTNRVSVAPASIRPSPSPAPTAIKTNKGGPPASINASFANVTSPQNEEVASPVESSMALDAELHMKHFNDELVRDNELMLQEIEGLRDENDVMFDELRRLRTENALLKEQNLELQESVNGQNEAFVRLSSEVAREITITQSLKQIFDNLNANRFDNLFTKRARAMHAELGRALTTKENYTLAKETLSESNRQINSIFEILDSMSKVPNFTTNAKDVLVLDATMQVISLCKLMNSMIVVEKEGKERQKQAREPYQAAAAMMTPRSAASQEKSGGIAAFFKNKFASPNTPKQNELEVETMVTVLTARAGDGPRHPAAVQLPNDRIQMPVTEKEVEKRATLMQRLANVFSSSSEGNLTARNLPPKRSTPPPQPQRTTTSHRPVSYSASTSQNSNQVSSPTHVSSPFIGNGTGYRQSMPSRTHQPGPSAGPPEDKQADSTEALSGADPDSKEVLVDVSPYRTSINHGGEESSQEPDHKSPTMVAETAPQLNSRHNRVGR